MPKRTTVIKEFYLFIRERKAYWMVPIIIIAVLIGVLVVLGETAVAPFIYAIF